MNIKTIGLIIIAAVTFGGTAFGRYEILQSLRGGITPKLVELQKNDPALAERFWGEVSEVKSKLTAMFEEQEEMRGEGSTEVRAAMMEALPGIRTSLKV